MVILCGVCVWHAAVGGAAEHYRVTNHNVTSPEVTSWPDTTSHELPNASAESTSCPLAAGDMATPEIAKIILADNIALAMFGSLYLLFHAVFVTFIYTSVSEAHRPVCYWFTLPLYPLQLDYVAYRFLRMDAAVLYAYF